MIERIVYVKNRDNFRIICTCCFIAQRKCDMMICSCLRHMLLFKRYAL